MPARRVAAFVGQKGGVGKSALARLLAVAAVEAGSRVLLADFDVEQQTCVEWGRRRLKAGIAPAIEARPFKSLKKLRSVDGAYDLIVADTRGLADGLTRDVALVSDVVFLPTGCSIDDLLPTLALAYKLQDEGVSGRVVFVLSKVGRSKRQIAATQELVRSGGFDVLDEVWPARESFQGDLDAGRVGSESKLEAARLIARGTAQGLLSRALPPLKRSAPAARRRSKPDAAAVAATSTQLSGETS